MNRQDFDIKVLPVMTKVAADLEAKQKDEYFKVANNAGVQMSSARDPMAARRIAETQPWNSKTTEDFLGMVADELKKEGIEYDTTVEKMMVDQLVSDRMPKTKADKVAYSIATNWFFQLSDPDKRCSLDDYIEREIDRRIEEQKTGKTKLAALGANAAGFTVATKVGTKLVGGPVGWVLFAADMGNFAADMLYKKHHNGNEYEMQFKERQLQEIAAVVKNTKPFDSDYVKVQLNADSPEIATNAQLSAAKKFANDNAELYDKQIAIALDEGETSVTVSGKTMEIKEAAQQSAKFYKLSELIENEQSRRSELAKTNDFDEANNIIQKTTSYPNWMLKNVGGNIQNASDNQLAEATKKTQTYIEVYSKEMDKVARNGGLIQFQGQKPITVQQAAQRIAEYQNFQDDINAELSARQQREEVAQKASVQHIPEPIKQETNMVNGTVNINNGQTVTPQVQRNGGWSSAVSSGLADLINNPGSALANLPDRIGQAFKEGKMGMNGSTLIPLIMVAFALKRHTMNPLLRFLMLFGGLGSFLGYANGNSTQQRQSALAQGPQASPSMGATQQRYKVYQDQPLNERIRDPKIVGDQLFFEVDGKPKVAQLNATLVDANLQGALPVNVIANRILAAQDALQAAAQNNLDMAAQQDQANQMRR